MNDFDFMAPEITLHSESDEYGQITVKEQAKVRSLYFDDQKKQSAILTVHPSVLLLEYTQVMMGALFLTQQPKRILLLGLGGGSMVHFLKKTLPQTDIEIVELRERVVELVDSYFPLPEGMQKQSIHCCDALHFVSKKLEESGDKYDIVFVDVFDGEGPSSLTGNVDFISGCKSLLTRKGVVVFNFWNRPIDCYPSIHKECVRVFQRAVLEVKLGSINSNVVLFGFTERMTTRDLDDMQDAAVMLQEKYGVAFTEILEMLKAQNFSTFQRLKQLIGC